MMKTWLTMAGLFFSLTACTWEFGTDARGQTHIRPKYPFGTGVYYTNGAASQNTHYHEMRPQQHAILPE